VSEPSVGNRFVCRRPPPPSRRTSRRECAWCPMGLRVMRTQNFPSSCPWQIRPCSARPKTIAPRRLQLFDDRRVIGRTNLPRIFEPPIERLIFDGEHIFDRDRNSQQAPCGAATFGQFLVCCICLRQRVIGIVTDKGVDFLSTRPIWSRHDCIASRAETSRFASFAASSEMVSWFSMRSRFAFIVRLWSKRL